MFFQYNLWAVAPEAAFKIFCINSILENEVLGTINYLLKINQLP